MKQLLTILLVLAGVASTAQTVTPWPGTWTPQTAAGYQFKRLKVDSSGWVFTKSGRFSDTIQIAGVGYVANPADGDSSTRIPNTGWVMRNAGTGGGYSLTLTTNFNGGAATYFGGVLNIPIYQTLLVSGSTIKTVNGSSLLGSGNLIVPTVSSFAKNMERDSIILTLSNATRLAVLDSVGAGGGTLQNAFDASVTAADDPTINGHGNSLTADSLATLRISAVNKASIYTSEAGMNVEYTGDTAMAQVSVHVQSDDGGAVTSLLTENTTMGHYLNVFPDRIELKNKQVLDTSIVQLFNIPVLGTAPANILSLSTDGKTIAKYPYPTSTGTVTSVSANAPILSSGGNTPVISADTSTSITGLATKGNITTVTNLANSKLSNITGLITSGSNISITGGGTSGNPYNISSSGSVADTISNINVAYVQTNGNNTTARLNNPAKPFLTIAAAIASLPAAGGKVKIGIGTFTAPDSSQVRSNLVLEGTKKPEYNWAVTQTSDVLTTYTAPTKLINGTIISGRLYFYQRTEVKIYNLGVDVGSDYITAGGVEGNGIAIKSSVLNTETPPYTLSTGIEVKNCIVLCRNAASPYHAVLIETALSPVVENVTTCYSTFGIVLKSVGGQINNTQGYSHKFAGIILKTNAYAISNKLSVNNFLITSLASNEGGGIWVQKNNAEPATTLINDVEINNGQVTYTQYGVKVDSAYSVNVSNVIASYTSTNGFQSNSQANFVNCTAHHNSGNGFLLNPIAGWGAINRIANTMVVNCAAYQNSTAGFDCTPGTSTDRVLLYGITSSYNGTYGLKGANTSVVEVGHCAFDGNTTAARNGTIDRYYVNTALSNTFTGNSAASSPVMSFIGTWYAAGNATTSKPHLLIEPSGTTSTGWTTTGTGLGINSASGFTGSLLDAQKAGISQFKVNNFGKISLFAGTNGSTNTATLVAGTVTVNTTSVTSSSKIFVSVNTPSGIQGFLSVPSASIVNATSFVINSTSSAETSTVNWWIIN